MIGGNVSEFVDNLYYGTEMYIIFREKKYFIQGWYDKPIHHLVLDYDYETEPFDGNNPDCHQNIWECSSKDPMECVNNFLSAPIWEGKTFYEVEKDMTWTD